jgi:hypothetical protein
VVVADRPLLEVESNPVGSELFRNKFKGTVTHGTGGVFCFYFSPPFAIFNLRVAMLAFFHGA